MKKLLLATALCAAGAAQAAAVQYDFSYIANNGVLVGSLVGELQADNNTIVVNSIVDFPSFAGVVSPLSLAGVVSISDALLGVTAPGRVSLDGQLMDILACNVVPDCDIGFGFIPPSVAGFTAFALGVAWGGGAEAFVPGNWSISAAAVVPEPAGLLLTGMALAGLAASMRRRLTH